MIENSIKKLISNSLKVLGQVIEEKDIIISVPPEKKLGDFSTNVALKFSKLFGKNPYNLANEIVDNMSKELFTKVEIVQPGFINFYLKVESVSGIIDKVIDLNDNFGTQPDKNITINIEYVSANPTGDLHLGHARGAAIGDSLARILKKDGYNVIREFYVNDAGAQIDNLGKSLRARYLQLFNIDAQLPEDGYHGDDIKNIAKTLKDEYDDKLINEDNLEFFKDYGKQKEMLKLQKDLLDFRVEFDVYSYETSIRSGGSVEKMLNKLSKYTYVQDDATYLKTSYFVDDKDRVIIKSDGSYTYFLPDIVYHCDKKQRNADYLIDVLGADHHGYINRMKSALMMNGYNEDTLEVEMIQMVRIVQNGEEIKMSKRTGNAIKLRDLSNEVGVDSCRYFFVNRAASSHLDFDINLAREQSSSNPVFYAQYAHARIQSVLAATTIKLNKSYDLLVENTELSLMKCLIEYDKIISEASKTRAPYKICNYIQKLSTNIHEFYSKCKVNDISNPELSGARLSLVKACSIVLKSALNLVGVEAPDKM